MTAELSFRFFDCDNHYYEAPHVEGLAEPA